MSPFELPGWALKSTPATEMDALLEWRLLAADVAAMTGVTVQAVNRWATIGRRGLVLGSRRFSEASTAPRVFRLYDLQQWARRVDVQVDLSKLHPGLARQWGIDADGTPVSLGSDGSDDA